MSIRIRKATLDDSEDILELDAVCLPGDVRPEWAPHNQWWVAEENGSVVGAVCLQPATDIKDAAAGYVSRVLVDPAHAGNGIATRMLRVVAKAAPGLGYEVLVSETRGYAMGNAFVRAGWRLGYGAYRWGFPDSIVFSKTLNRLVKQ